MIESDPHSRIGRSLPESFDDAVLNESASSPHGEPERLPSAESRSFRSLIHSHSTRAHMLAVSGFGRQKSIPNSAHSVDVLPEAGKLVLFDSVSLPHLVREVTGDRHRVAATGWFHEDSQFHFEMTA